jgi:hypothetical protein
MWNKNNLKMLMVTAAILCAAFSVSGCASAAKVNAADTFNGPPLESASAYGMSASVYFAETDGYAAVNGRQQHYYLYQWTDIPDIEILSPLIARWIQQNGYDIGEGQLIENDKDLADSVKTLMRTKDANCSVTIFGNDGNLLLYMNFYNTNDNTYDTVFWPLIKTK